MPESSSAPAEWFTALVAEVCAEVTATADVQASLKAIGEVTAQPPADKARSVAQRIAGSADMIGDLRARFPDELLAWQLLEELENLNRASARHDAANQRLEEPLSAPGDPGRRAVSFAGLSRLRPTGRRALRETRRQALIAAEAEADSARMAMELATLQAQLNLEAFRARMSENAGGPAWTIGLSGDPGRIESAKQELSATLRRQLVAPVALLVNAIIDGELTASYERAFSYISNGPRSGSQSAGNAARAFPERT